MYSDVYQSIWFELGIMVDTIVICILILVYLTLTLMQGHRGVRKQKLLRQLSHEVSISLKGICYTAETCWCDDPYTHCISSI